MKYEMEIEIDLPRQTVVELFDDPENMKHWQPSLLSYRHLSGTPGQVGAKSEHTHKLGKRSITMVETVTARNLPDELSGTYEAKGAWNNVVNRFSEIGAEKTLWKTENEFICSGFMRIMAFLMPSGFKKETWKNMESFKRFAELSVGGQEGS